MRHSPVDKRAKRAVPRQNVSDYGMHKDAAYPPIDWASVHIHRGGVSVLLSEHREWVQSYTFAPATGRVIYCGKPNQESDNG